jgi:hypothetical protein
MGIVKVADMPEALPSFLTGVVGFVGAFAITFKFLVLVYFSLYKLFKCEILANNKNRILMN